MALKRYVSKFDSRMEVLAALDVGTLWDRMLGEFLGEFIRLERQGLGKKAMAAQMEAFMDGLSNKPVADLGRKSSSVAYNQGRNAEILTAGAQKRIDSVVRSELLDGDNCDTCADLDGIVAQVGTADFDKYAPPNLCEGGDRCRGFYVSIGKA